MSAETVFTFGAPNLKFGPGAADDGGDSIFKSVILQSVTQKAREVAIFFRKREGIGKRCNRSPKFLFDDFFGIAQFVVNLLRPERAQVRMGHGMRPELNPFGVQFANLAPGQIIRAFDTHGGVLDSGGGQKNRRREAALFQDGQRVGIKITISVVKGNNEDLGKILPGFHPRQHLR